jgi:acyl-CoA thioesterase II
MGDFADDTAIEAIDEATYRAELSTDWQIWGPMGGYVAAVAMRAAGAQATLPRPASFYCHFLSATKFGPIELRVTPLRRGRSAESLRVLVVQDDREVMDATVWLVAENEGLEHEVTDPPEVADADSLKSLAEHYADMGADAPPFAFWDNFDARPISFRHDWPPPGPLEPVWRQWLRFVPASTFDDPWLDAARYVLLCDLPSWPACTPHHAWKWGQEPAPWIAPTLDLYVAFHQLVADDPWLLVDGKVPVAADGLLGCHARIWSSDRRLVAAGGGQGFFRRVRH